ncbi:hypothetical protein WH43_02455 [Rheinheimera sp. KL1]|uniref:hypothetical protein n=1 Tax=Rheinheimera sp. KL1 TaxID=1635005 RepID=UPI0006A9822D|nr:hypothetical protein [Rheinheimera sp. KL1]KOO59645.1 hypothetical protein WH43_02455 [Rheinheimera sp. KL1]
MTNETYTKFITADGQPFVTKDDFDFAVLSENMQKAVDYIEQIPPDAKQAVKDFINDKIELIMEHISDLSKLDITSEVIDKIPNVIEYLKLVLDYCNL